MGYLSFAGAAGSVIIPKKLLDFLILQNEGRPAENQ
jgi:hypothetical protein